MGRATGLWAGVGNSRAAGRAAKSEGHLRGRSGKSTPGSYAGAGQTGRLGFLLGLLGATVCLAGWEGIRGWSPRKSLGAQKHALSKELCGSAALCVYSSPRQARGQGVRCKATGFGAYRLTAGSLRLTGDGVQCSCKGRGDVTKGLRGVVLSLTPPPSDNPTC